MGPNAGLDCRSAAVAFSVDMAGGPRDHTHSLINVGTQQRNRQRSVGPPSGCSLFRRQFEGA